jgi:hypothetical protein
MAKSMPAPIAVRPVKERGASTSFAANTAAVSPSLTTVQSTTTACSSGPDHSTKHKAIA